MESLKTLFGDFEKAVRHGEDFPWKGELEATLRRYLVRSSWSQGEHRKNLRWEAEGLDVEAILPTFALERVIGESLEGGSRTHISSRRESLCSSWAAAAKSLETFGQATGSSVSWVGALAALLRRGKGGPKADARMLKAVEELARLAEREKRLSSLSSAWKLPGKWKDY